MSIFVEGSMGRAMDIKPLDYQATPRTLMMTDDDDDEDEAIAIMPKWRQCFAKSNKPQWRLWIEDNPFLDTGQPIPKEEEWTGISKRAKNRGFTHSTLVVPRWGLSSPILGNWKPHYKNAFHAVSRWVTVCKHRYLAVNRLNKITGTRLYELDQAM